MIDAKKPMRVPPRDPSNVPLTTDDRDWGLRRQPLDDTRLNSRYRSSGLLAEMMLVVVPFPCRRAKKAADERMRRTCAAK